MTGVVSVWTTSIGVSCGIGTETDEAVASSDEVL